MTLGEITLFILFPLVGVISFIAMMHTDVVVKEEKENDGSESEQSNS
jgi:hypothetical protein